MPHTQREAKERFFAHEGLVVYSVARQAVQFVAARPSWR
jgi:hypothetical protein